MANLRNVCMQHFKDVNATNFSLYSLLWYILEYVLKSFSIHGVVDGVMELCCTIFSQ